MARLDDVNLRILQLLQRNGRMTHVDLAQALGRAETTVRERIAGLERAGLLQGYGARVDWARVGLGATAVLRAACPPDRIRGLTAALAAMPSVTEVLHLSSGRPLLVVLQVRDVAHLHSTLLESLAAAGVEDVEVELALETLVTARPPGAPAPPLAAQA